TPSRWGRPLTDVRTPGSQWRLVDSRRPGHAAHAGCVFVLQAAFESGDCGSQASATNAVYPADLVEVNTVRVTGTLAVEAGTIPCRSRERMTRCASTIR